MKNFARLKKFMNILLVENHTGFRSSVRQFLEVSFSPILVVETGSGEEALEYLLDGIPDIILLDTALPGIDGIETARRISSLHPQSRIVMLTSHAEPDIIETSMCAGAIGFIAKQDASLDLIDCIESVMKKRAYVSRSMKLKNSKHHPYNFDSQTVH
jgi:DNA-binding NarL/FixJ family response regulator